ncbi:MAG: exonuclease domain-containing protein [Clostridia bacterium]|nr:exonuclease domain-containing protein [Clostridia bacterium]
MQFVVLDLEWNNVYGKKIKSFFNEIIEIGAVKLDEQLNICDEFSCLIKAQVGKKLRLNTRQITHLTNEDLENGVTFPRAISLFKKWIGSEETVTLSWGDGDVRTLIDNGKYFGLGEEVPYLQNYADLQKYFQRMIKRESKQQIGLKNAAELVGIDVENLSLHRALDDSRLAAECLKKIYDKKILEEYIYKCDADFYKRLRYKIKVISFIKNPLVDKSYLKYKCEKCGGKAQQLTSWKYSNQYFRANFYCPKCDHAVTVMVRFRKMYDSTEIKKVIKPLPKAENSEQKPESQENDNGKIQTP